MAWTKTVLSYQPCIFRLYCKLWKLIFFFLIMSCKLCACHLQYGPWTQLIKRYFILLMCLQIWREYHRDKDCISAVIPVSENQSFLRKIDHLIIITVFLMLTMYLKSRFLNYNIVPNCKDSNWGTSAFEVWPNMIILFVVFLFL